MTTRIYGTSDDLIEFEGDVHGEFSAWNTEENPVLVVCSDGTILEVSYGGGDAGIWAIKLVHKGSKFDRIEECPEETDHGYSDQAFFHDGLTFACAAKDWERVS